MNDFLPDLVFEHIAIACAAKHPRLQNFTLSAQEFGKFNPQFFDMTIFHVVSFEAAGDLLAKCRIKRPSDKAVRALY